MKISIVKTFPQIILIISPPMKQPRLVVYCIDFSVFFSPVGPEAQPNKTGVNITIFYFTIHIKMSITRYNTWFESMDETVLIKRILIGFVAILENQLNCGRIDGQAEKWIVE